MATSTCSNIDRQIVFKVVDEIQTFISGMNQVKHAVHVSYYVKWRNYRAKVIVIVRNQSTSSTIMYCLSKVRSLGEIPMFKAMLDGITVAVNRFVESLADSASSSDN